MLSVILFSKQAKKMKKTVVWVVSFLLSTSVLVGCNRRSPKLIELENQYRSHPDDSYTKLKLAMGYAFFAKNIEDFEKGIDIFEEYLKDNPRDSKAHVFYGMALIKMSEYEKNDFDKLAWLRKGLNQMDFTEEIFPDEILIYLVRGMASLNIPEDYIKENQRISDFEKALAILNKSKEFKHKEQMETLVNYHYIKALNSQGQKEKARQIYKKFSEKIRKNKQLDSVEYQFELLTGFLS